MTGSGADETTPGFVASCGTYRASVEAHLVVLSDQREAGFLEEGKHADEVTYWNGVLEMLDELTGVLEALK